MSFQVLARKWRPRTFAELVGQEHVVRALRNAVINHREGQAYLFSGPRGTGKTTSARILARALNCLDLGTDGEPCGTCDNCAAVAAGAFYDLVELDAADDDPEVLGRLPYLGAVVDETLRLRPVTVDNMRLLRKPWQLGTWAIPAGTAVAAMATITVASTLICGSTPSRTLE